MEKTWWERFTCDVGLSERDRRNQRILLAWMFAWMAAWVGASLLIDRVLATGSAATLVAALAPNLLGIAAVRAFMTFLREVEELQRKVQLDALAFAFGVGVMAIIGLELANEAGLYEGSPTDALMFMAVSYSLGVTLGWRRYR